MNFQYGIDPSNPRLRIERSRAQRSAMWASFGYFLAKADAFILHYWPPDEGVQPLLALGFQPEPTPVSPKARLLHGALTPQLRKFLWGPGKGEVPWFTVELMRDHHLIYYIEEHEGTAGWNCSEAELQELYAAGVDPSVVVDYVEQRQQSEARQPVSRGLELLAAAVARVTMPTSTGYGYGTTREPNAWTGRGCGHFDAGTGGKVWLDYDPEAAMRVPDLEAALALMTSLHPPLLRGDALRLDLVDGQTVLTRTARGLGLWRRNFTHALVHPNRMEWLTAVRTVGDRADRFVMFWTEEPAGANGWRSDYGRDRLIPFATDSGPSDSPANARQMVGPVTPAVLELICGEPPHGLVDLEHHEPGWSPGDVPPAPWWWLLLLSGEEVILGSRGNGYSIDLQLKPEEAALLNRPDGRLFDHALARRRNQTWLALTRALEKRVIGTRPPTDFQFFSMATRHSEIRLEGVVIASITVEPQALDLLLEHPDPGNFLANAPAPAHVMVELAGETVRWRQISHNPGLR